MKNSMLFRSSSLITGASLMISGLVPRVTAAFTFFACWFWGVLSLLWVVCGYVFAALAAAIAMSMVAAISERIPSVVYVSLMYLDVLKSIAT